MGDVKLTFEELNTVLLQIDACLNSRPLTPLPDSDNSIEALTPGHFLIGKRMEALPDPSASYERTCMPLLCHWHLCQSLVRHFWADGLRNTCVNSANIPNGDIRHVIFK